MNRMLTLAGASLIAIGAFGSATTMPLAAAGPDDLGQIKQAVASELSALQSLDPVIYGEQFCSDYNSVHESQFLQNLTAPSLDDISQIDSATLKARVSKTFSHAPQSKIDAFVQAAANNDADAYDAAWLDLVRSEYATYSYRVRSATITGDTANVVVSTKFGSDPAKTDTWPFVLQDGQWKDCTPLQPAS